MLKRRAAGKAKKAAAAATPASITQKTPRRLRYEQAIAKKKKQMTPGYKHYLA